MEDINLHYEKWIFIIIIRVVLIYYFSMNKTSSDCVQNFSRLEKKCESLEGEILEKNIDNVRYEFILELLRERDTVMVDEVTYNVEQYE